ncbi:serine/threonine-protein kinase [Oryzisolibacter sp. LB2S]|uniref:serine/threonine protein kinase n=1 Tax=Alicycliphilus soli TaxID=3228789 RepID=UPI0034578201
MAPADAVRHAEALPPGTRLKEFEIQALLGVGGFGMVYQAFDHSLQRSVAIKEYMPARLAGRADGQSLWVRSSSDAQSYQAGLASFVDEARLLARFDHPSLVKVFRFWEANHTAYMVMPLYRGMTLKQARARMRTPPSEDWLRQLLWSLMGALRVLHEGQALHRDLSPDNIFLQDHGPPVLLDLGAARHTVGAGSDRHAAVLKVNYAPLEQYGAAGALEQGPWTDLYALGAVVHGCLSGVTPQPATARAEHDRMPSFARLARSVHKRFGLEYSPPFVAAMAQCLALDPRDRPQSVAALMQAMDMVTAPQGHDEFDFRAALGDGAAAPQGAGAQDMAAPPVSAQASIHASAHALRTVVSRRVSAILAMPPLPHVPSVQVPQRIATRSPGLVMGAAAASAAAVVITAGSLWWGADESQPYQTPESEIITEVADPPMLTAQPLAPHEGPARAVDWPAPVAAKGAPIILPASDAPVARPQPAYRAVDPAAQLPDSATVRAIRDAAAVAAAAPQRPAMPGQPSAPQEPCASAGFFARPICLQRECQRAEMAAHPVCVDLRSHQQAREAEALRRQLYTQ